MLLFRLLRFLPFYIYKRRKGKEEQHTRVYNNNKMPEDVHGEPIWDSICCSLAVVVSSRKLNSYFFFFLGRECLLEGICRKPSGHLLLLRLSLFSFSKNIEGRWCKHVRFQGDHHLSTSPVWTSDILLHVHRNHAWHDNISKETILWLRETS